MNLDSQRPIPTLDMDDTSNAFTVDDFKNALKRVSRKIKPDKSDSEKA